MKNTRRYGKTPHTEAVRLMELGWRWNGRKYANREAWHAAMKESFEKSLTAVATVAKVNA